ncbi:hypothetical protein A3Q56_07161 [Intoshia linei]|uniref:C2 domain-containing protein n=1 Tax=Intoshia linei TaxID=1819745 RepID=A0A177AUP1_9BILA|nr:hypothetical protein A3Q56_07161 [Intoshia linei]
MSLMRFLSLKKTASTDGKSNQDPNKSPILESTDIGAINFSIHYDHFDNILTIKIIRAIKLPAMDITGTSDPYVKISLLPDKRPVLKTNVKRKNLNPIWNETFAFEGMQFYLKFLL